MALSGFFLLCLLAGLFYAIITVFLGSFTGGHDTSATDAGGTGHGVSGEVHFSPMSPMIIATFVTTFGAGGLAAAKGMGMTVIPAVTVATASGLGFGALAFLIFRKVYSATQSSSEVEVATLVGTQAEVITPIGKDVVGEIVYVSKGSRFTAPARSLDNLELAKNTPVEIVRVVGNTFYVKPSRR
ncbi:MAG TPA: NfeD family protein [Verrucomicrobiae bacterium]|nr:NfeD family protein [Verrucomicrobiae bacterium]